MIGEEAGVPRDTRQAILNTAKRLFNERGYNDVTTRDIADALSISKGNLTYYFKKKEDIVEALVAEPSGDEVGRPPKTVAELDGFLSHIQDVVQENAFYFWHHAQLAQVSPRIHELQAAAFKRNAETLMGSFRLLVEGGLMREEEYPGEHRRASDAVLLASVYWIPFCELREDPAREGFSAQAWAALYPLLTEQGKAAYAACRVGRADRQSIGKDAR